MRTRLIRTEPGRRSTEETCPRTRAVVTRPFFRVKTARLPVDGWVAATELAWYCMRAGRLRRPVKPCQVEGLEPPAELRVGVRGGNSQAFSPLDASVSAMCSI